MSSPDHICVLVALGWEVLHFCIDCCDGMPALPCYIEFFVQAGGKFCLATELTFFVMKFTVVGHCFFSPDDCFVQRLHW